jgi:hypothetical protein
MAALVAETALTLRSPEAAPVAKRGNSSAESGKHTIPMMTANSTTVTASHTISATGFWRIALTAIIHPSRGLTPTVNAAGRIRLPRRRRQKSWQNPVHFWI